MCSPEFYFLFLCTCRHVLYLNQHPVSLLVSYRVINCITQSRTLINSPTFPSMMTDQKPPTPKYDDNTVEEASSLLLFGQGGGGGGVPVRTKKHGVSTITRTMVVTTCVVLGTLAMLYYGGRGSSSNTASSDGIAADLLRGYDPSQDFCFKDEDNDGKYCWYPTDGLGPCGNWKGEGGHGYNDCGRKCTKIYEQGARRIRCVSV